MFLRKLAIAALTALALWAPVKLDANQSNTWSPTTGTVSGLQLTTNYNNAFSAVQSCNSGAVAPANDVSLAAVKGQCWLDTSTTPNPVRMYDGVAANWLIVGWLDTTNHQWLPNLSGPIFIVASAATTDLCGSPVAGGLNILITGAVTITSFGNSCPTGIMKTLSFNNAGLTLTHSASLFLPNNGGNIVAAAGDNLIAQYLTTGWRVVVYQKFNGAALSATANFTSTVSFNGVISPAALASNTADWNPAGLATANVIRFSCSSPISIQGIVAPVTEGQVLQLTNIGATNACKLTSQDAAETTAANRFALDRAIFIRPGRTLAIKYDLTTARWVLWQENTAQPIAAGFKNLRILNVANALGDTAPGTPNNQNKIVLDEITLEDASGGSVRIDTSYAYSCTVDITGSTFNASTGGIDTGAVAASTQYYHWVIYNPTTDTPSCLSSVSATAPTMPSGFTFKARVGANFTDASANKCFNRVQQYGRTAHYLTVGTIAGCTATNGPAIPVLTAGAAVGTFNTSVTITALASTSLAGFIPATAGRVYLIVTNKYKGNTTADIAIAPNSSANYTGTNNGPTGANGVAWPVFFNSGTGILQTTPFPIDLEAQSLGIAALGTGTGIFVWGWDDNLN